ncbi:hypothetical protein MMC30_002464 [Trapelia coarctata]|nr:hypothetical protein [Trapelia coarctata]
MPHLPHGLFSRKDAVPAVPVFEVRLDDSTLVLYGPKDEAKGVTVKGVLVLSLTQPLEFQKITVDFKCDARVAFPRYGGPHVDWVVYNTPRMDFNLLTKTPEDNQPSMTLDIGNYGWPFEAELPGDAPESVEGLLLSWIGYRVRAIVDTGRRSRDMTFSQHVRVIRTYFRDSVDFPAESRYASKWNDRIEYEVSTPLQSVIFGSKFRVDFSLVPLLKGLAITEISCRLVETQIMTAENSAGDLLKEHEFERIVCEEKWCLPEGAETEDIDGREGYRSSGCLIIPRSLKRCLQSVEERECGIKVVHRIEFRIELLRPEGNTCTVNGRLPIDIYLSPENPIGANNALIDQSSRTTEGIVERATQAPPAYGDHSRTQRLSEFYSEIDPTGYYTPAGGALTPFSAVSRRNSQDDQDEAATSSAVAANTLHNRLADLSTNDTSPAGPSTARPRSPTPTPTHGGRYPTNTEDISNPDCGTDRPSRNWFNFRHVEHGPGKRPAAKPNNSHNGSNGTTTPSLPPTYESARTTSGVHTPTDTGLPTYETATGSRPSTPPVAIRRSPSDRALSALGGLLRPLQRRTQS